MGAAILTHYPYNAVLFPGWWLFAVKVHPFFWGAGLGEELVSQALQKAEELGAPSVSLFTSEKNYAALGLYRKLGFQIMPVPNASIMEQYLESLSRTGGRRIVLSKSLPCGQPSFISADIRG